MCEAKAYLLTKEGEEEVMEAVDEIVAQEGKLILRSIFGEEKTLKARLKAFSLVNHRALLEPLD